MKTQALEPNRIRLPAAAGRFYPSDPQQLRNLLEQLLAQAAPPEAAAPKALIVPHAGYIYSGAVAASAYSQLRPEREAIHRVVVIGPAHYADFAGLALSSAQAFATPLGHVPVDIEAAERLLSLPQIQIVDPPHAREHSLEVQLPFLQIVLPDFRVIPLAVGEATAPEIKQVIEFLWGGRETVFIISSDLSHYHDLRTAAQLDQATAEAIQALAPEKIGEEQACGRNAIRGLLLAAKQRGLKARALDLRNSGTAGGPSERVVGYGAFALS